MNRRNIAPERTKNQSFDDEGYDEATEAAVLPFLSQRRMALRPRRAEQSRR